MDSTIDVIGVALDTVAFPGLGLICMAFIKTIRSLCKKPQKPIMLKYEQVSGVNPNKSLDDLLLQARRKLGIDPNCYNIAICGSSGVGKSTFINKFLDLKGPDAAACGVTETTKEIRRYRNARLPHAALWDFPGANTTDHPAATYYMDKMLYAFDCILILSSDRFLQTDFEIAQQAKYKHVAVVRTKADIGAKSIAQMDENMKMNEAGRSLRQQVNQSFREKMPPGIPLFIISSWAFSYKKNPYRDDDDNSLQKMDEEGLLEFIEISIKSRNPSY